MIMRPFGLVAKFANQIIFEDKTKPTEVFDEILHIRLVRHLDMLIIVGDRQEIVELMDPALSDRSKSPLPFSS